MKIRKLLYALLINRKAILRFSFLSAVLTFIITAILRVLLCSWQNPALFFQEVFGISIIAGITAIVAGSFYYVYQQYKLLLYKL